jgi:hypothetical protein
MPEKRVLIGFLFILGTAAPVARGVAVPQSMAHAARVVSAPAHCPPAPQPRVLSPEFGPGVGYYPVWSVGIGGYPASLPCGNSCVQTPHGWDHKDLLVVAARLRGRVTLQGGQIGGTGRLWFENEDPNHVLVKYVKILHLDPAWQHNPASKQMYIGFPGGIVFPRSGRYYLEARYPGGTWCFSFTARH